MKNGLIVDENGTKEYFKEDNLHKEDGPAIEYVRGKIQWFLRGQEYTEQEFNAFKLDHILSNNNNYIKKPKI